MKCQTLLREKDIITSNRDIEHIETLKNFPIFMGCTTAPYSSDITADMEWGISRSSGCIQLEKLIPLDILYQESHGSGSIGKLWQEHHKAFATFIKQFSPKEILEIGGGHGILSCEYMNIAHAEWTIIEPNPSPREGVPARYIKAFIDESFTPDRNFDAIIHSHVFEHIYNPNDFLKYISNFMPEDSLHICTFPNMKAMLKKGFSNTLNFEHTYFLTEEYAEYMFNKAGYQLLEKELFKDDHSIFYAWKKKKSYTEPSLNEDLYEQNKSLFNRYISDIKKCTDDLNNKILEASAKSSQIFLFGAHIFSQQLLSLGLDEKHIISIIDNDNCKCGKRLCGSHLIVESPQILRNCKSPVVILKMGAYSNEIRNDILNNINSSTEFLE